MLVRTRFAPSPTGYLHIGGARTALYSWLYARRHGGVFILRIEDTDKARSTDENTKAILDGLRWLGLDWDEGPFLQSARTEVYREHAERLLSMGKAYRCYCTKEELDAKRAAAEKAKTSYRYDRRCRYPARNGITGPRTGPFVVRVAFEEEGQTIVHDLVKGDVVFENRELSDEPILRDDGTPLYNFCVVVDDAEMKVTHVLRGDDHLNNTPKQIQMYKAFGFELPKFGHLPLIFGPDKKKMSKRNNVVALDAYRDMGFLPESMINFLARLGWAHGDEEMFTLARLKEVFDLEGVSKSSGIYDMKRLENLNQTYIKGKPAEELIPLLQPVFGKRGWKMPDRPTLEIMIRGTRERSITLEQMADHLAFWFVEEPAFEPKAFEKFLRGRGELIAAISTLLAASSFDPAELEAALTKFAESRSPKVNDTYQPLRVALTGVAVGPSIFDILVLLGKDRVLARLERAKSKASE